MRLAVAMLVLSSSAWADDVDTARTALAQERAKSQGQVEYVPFIVDQQTFNQINAYLGDQPMKFAAPIASWLARSEEAAIKAKEKPNAQQDPKASPDNGSSRAQP